MAYSCEACKDTKKYIGFNVVDVCKECLDNYSVPTIDGTCNVFWVNEHGDLHRTDGPAIEWCGGGREWWLNGVKYTEEEFRKVIK